jgi:hypothetical protein
VRECHVGRFDDADSGILDRTHLRFFTRRSIHKLFDNPDVDQVSIHRLRYPNQSRLSRLVATALGDLGCKQFVIVARRAQTSLNPKS